MGFLDSPSPVAPKSAKTASYADPFAPKGDGGVGNRVFNPGAGRPSTPPPQPMVPIPATGLGTQATGQAIGLQQGLQFFQGIYGPQLAQQQALLDQLAGKIGFAEADTALGLEGLNKQFGIDTAKLGLQGQGIDVERGAINRQIGNVGTLENLARQLFGTQNKGFGIDEKEAKERKATQRRGEFSENTARGSFNTPGIQRDLADIQRAFMNTMGRIGLGREQASIGHQEKMLGLGEQRMSLQDQNKMLDLRSQGLGLQRQELKNNLDQGISRLNLDKMITVTDLLAAMNSADLQTRAIAEQIYREALGASDFFANMPSIGF